MIIFLFIKLLQYSNFSRATYMLSTKNRSMFSTVLEIHWSCVYTYVHSPTDTHLCGTMTSHRSFVCIYAIVSTYFVLCFVYYVPHYLINLLGTVKCSHTPCITDSEVCTCIVNHLYFWSGYSYVCIMVPQVSIWTYTYNITCSLNFIAKANYWRWDYFL